MIAVLGPLVAWGAGDGRSEPLLVVVREDAPVDAVSVDALADLYLGRARGPLVPLDRSEDALRAAFYQRLLGQSLNRVRAYWAKRVFTGRGRPPEAISADGVARALEDAGLRVTYVPAGQQPAGSKVLLILEAGGP